MIVRNLVFQPPATTRSSQALVSANVDSTHLWLKTRLGTKIEAFYIDRRAPSTILFSHANAEDVSMIYAWLRDLSLRLKVTRATLRAKASRQSRTCILILMQAGITLPRSAASAPII